MGGGLNLPIIRWVSIWTQPEKGFGAKCAEPWPWAMGQMVNMNSCMILHPSMGYATVTLVRRTRQRVAVWLFAALGNERVRVPHVLTQLASVCASLRVARPLSEVCPHVRVPQALPIGFGSHNGHSTTPPTAPITRAFRGKPQTAGAKRASTDSI